MSSEAAVSRQVLLPEVGAEGQAKIRAAVFEIAAGSDGDIEALYLERAGALTLHRSDELEAVPFRHAENFRFSASRELGAGAWRALRGLRRALGVATE